MHNEKEIKFYVDVGDWSRDGHEKSEQHTIYAAADATFEGLKASYEAGCKLIGFDYLIQVATDYEEGWLTREHYDKLKAAGINVEKILLESLWASEKEINDFESNDKEHLAIGTEDFVRILVAILNLDGKNLITYRGGPSDNPAIFHGGYGLFY